MTVATPPAPAPAAKGKKRARDGDDGELALGQLVGRAALPFVLRMLTGLVYGHPSSQSLGAQLSALRPLQQLEGMASSSRVGPLAESLLQALMLNNDEVSRAVADLRGLKKQQKKQKALDQRAKMLAQMGFASAAAGPGGSKSKTAQQLQLQSSAAAHLSSFAGGLDSLDESGATRLKCSVCLEGYAYKPTLQLGFYVYNAQCVLGAGGVDDGASGGSSGEESVGVTTVSHFSLIHYSCHREAAKADKKLKPPKSEWEGATIRNQHTLCNNLFPILQPPASVTQSQSQSSGGGAGESDLASRYMAAMLGVRGGGGGSSPPSAASAAAASSVGGSGSGSASSALLDPSSPLWDGADMDASLEQYQAAVEQYWSHIPFHQSFVASRLELVRTNSETKQNQRQLRRAHAHGSQQSNAHRLVPRYVVRRLRCVSVPFVV
jgi:hypothetical protein